MSLKKLGRLGALFILVAGTLFGDVHDAAKNAANVFLQLNTFSAGIIIGNVTVNVPATVTSYTVTLPSGPGDPGDFLGNNGTPGDWTFVTPPSGSFTAGLDLAGTGASQKVVGMESYPFYGLPANGQAYEYNATVHEWIPNTLGDPYVLVAWLASTSSGVTGYNVYRGTTSGGPYTKISPGSGVDLRLFYPDTTVTHGTTYYYVITAVAGGVEGTDSGEVSATP